MRSEMSHYDSVLDWTLSESDSDPVTDGRRRTRSEVRWSPRSPRRRGGSRWRSVSRLTGRTEKERLARIERENQILLQKILDCHLGYDRRRTSHIPRAPRTQEIRSGIFYLPCLSYLLPLLYFQMLPRPPKLQHHHQTRSMLDRSNRKPTMRICCF